MIAMLLWQPSPRLYGTGGSGNGTIEGAAGFNHVEISLMAHADMTDANKANPALEKTSEPKDVEIAQDISSAVAPSAPAIEEVSLEAVENSSQQSHNARGGSPGSPDGTLSLVDQIAKCLPIGVRPDFAPATLSIALDADGGLSATPTLNVDIAGLSRDELRNADFVVKAALQCGPYEVARGADGRVEVVANFMSAGQSTP